MSKIWKCLHFKFRTIFFYIFFKSILPLLLKFPAIYSRWRGRLALLALSIAPHSQPSAVPYQYIMNFFTYKYIRQGCGAKISWWYVCETLSLTSLSHTLITFWTRFHWFWFWPSYILPEESEVVTIFFKM